MQSHHQATERITVLSIINPGYGRPGRRWRREWKGRKRGEGDDGGKDGEGGGRERKFIE